MLNSSPVVALNPHSPSKASPVSDGFSALDQSISSLGINLAQLRDRLTPISTPRPPQQVTEKNPQPQHSTSMVVKGLHEARQRVDNLGNEINDIMALLDL